MSEARPGMTAKGQLQDNILLSSELARLNCTFVVGGVYVFLFFSGKKSSQNCIYFQVFALFCFLFLFLILFWLKDIFPSCLVIFYLENEEEFVAFFDRVHFENGKYVTFQIIINGIDVCDLIENINQCIETKKKSTILENPQKKEKIYDIAMYN